MMAIFKKFLLKRIDVWSDKRHDTTIFLSNCFNLEATEINLLHGKHWRIELQFK